MTSATRVLTLSNGLSILRAFLAFPIVYSLYASATPVTVVLVVLAVLTDFLDGFLARKAHEITNLGRVLDPLADAVVILAVTLFLFMDETRHFPGWILILYVLRYLTIALLAVFVMNHFSVSLGSKWTGKATVTVSALAIFLYIIRIQPLGLYVLLVATALAITSWFQYLVGYSSYFRK